MSKRLKPIPQFRSEVEERSDDMADRLPQFAADLVNLKVDAIVTTTAAGVQAAKQATATIPIIMAGVDDAVDQGFVASLAKPGGNITGTSWLNTELSAVAVRLPNELASAFSTLTARHAHAVLALSDAVFGNEAQLARLAAQHRWPAMYARREFAEAGGLMAYGPNFSDNYRRAASYVDKILKDAKPGDLPVEQPTTFELVINLKTAKALGLAIPQSLLLRADEVIQW